MANSPAMLGIITFGQAASRLGRRAVVDALVKDGMPRKAAMAKAGYQRGPYGTGVETRGDAFFKSTAVYGSQPAGRLSEVADVHEDIETAYPGIGQSLRVEVVPDGEWAARVAAARRSLRLWERDGGAASAFYDHGNNLIAVRAQMPGESIKGYVDRADGSLVHELQHYAQHQDGLRPPRRHVDTYDYKVDGLEVEARNSAARRKLTPAERVEMPREMTQDVKPADVRQDWGGGSVRNETALASAPAPSPRIRLEPEEPRTVIRAKTSYEKWQDEQRKNDSFIHDVIDELPGRPVRNAARSLVYGAARFGEGMLRVAHELSGPLRPFGSDRFAYNGFGKLADAIDSEIERHPYEYDPDDTQIAPVAEGLVNLGLTAWFGGRVAKLGGGSAFGRGLGQAVLPATFGANAKAQALRQMEAEGIDTTDPVNQLMANARGAASAALWAVPFGRYRGTPVELAGVSYAQRVGRGAANIFTRAALDDFAGSGTLLAATERAIANAQDSQPWQERMTEQERKEYLRDLEQVTSPVFDPHGRRIYSYRDYDGAVVGVNQKHEQIVHDRELRESIARALRGLGEAADHALNVGTTSAVLFGPVAPAGSKFVPGNSRIGSPRIPVQQDAKGGDNFGTFRNFLATDDVPESIFGIPVVQDESQYTEKDLKFFRENPKAAGFYDLGGEEVDGDVPQQAVKVGGPLVPATLSDEGRPMHMFRDEDGKVTGYGTTRSIVHESDGRFFVVPTIVPGQDGGTRVLGDDEAARRFSETGEHWGGYADRQAAEEAAEAVHERHARLYGRAWNDYIQNHWDEMSDEIRSDPGVLDARHARTRGAYPGSLNNPGNVEKRKERRQGEVDSPHERWAKFATPQDGLREMADAIRQIAAVKLAEKGLPFTIRNFAGVYAPSTENATAKYVADISADSGFDPDTELHRFDEGDMAKFLKSVVRFESGAPHSAWFTDEEYTEAAKKLQEGAVD